MTYEFNANADDFAKGGHHFRHSHGDRFGWAKRPGFNPVKALALVTGIAIFPPLGIAALGYFIWKGRRFRQDGQSVAGEGRGFGGVEGRGGCGRGNRMGRTGNVAFDEHRAKVLNDLEAERQAFAEDRAEQRRQHDKEAFDAFQAKRNAAGQYAEGDEAK
jgi:Protein of unknown function (DUF2852)